MTARRGFTLVETLVTLAVVGVFLGLLYQLLITQQRSYRVQEDLADAQQNARVALDELSRALASLGAGTAVEQGQPRLLVAHEHEVVFTADLSGDFGAQAPGTAVPGAGPRDPFQTFPPGAYAGSPAETYRYYLGQRTGEPWYTLYRQVNGGAGQAVAMLLANPTREEPLFRYLGDFDGNGTEEWLDRVDRTTSPRIAAGEPLDAVIRRIEIRVLAETAHPDPRYPLNQGHRQVRFTTTVAPRNLWDCPIVTATPYAGPGLRAPDLLGVETPLVFRVTRGGVPEAGRTLVLSIQGPPGHGAAVTDATGNPTAVTDASGVATAKVVWPAGCDQLPEGTYTVTARTSEPPTLQTPFGSCPPYEDSVTLEVGSGLPASVRFDAGRLEVASCGAEVATGFRVLDGCARPVRADDAAAHPVALEIGPDPEFGTLSRTALDEPSGELRYRSRVGSYANYGVSRSPADPNRFVAWIQASAVPGRVDLEVFLEPHALVDLTGNIVAAAYTDCPDPTTPVTDTFGVEDACGNPLWTLGGTGESVRLELRPQPSPGGTPDQGAVASPGNRDAFSADPVDITAPDGVAPGEFALRYRPPTCTVGGLPYRPEVRLTPSWDPGQVRVLPVALAPCTGCSVQVLDSAGTPTTRLNQECDGRSDVVITQCVPTGTTAEVVIEPDPGSYGAPSFDRNRAADRVTVTFTGAGPGQTARIPLYIGTARSGDRFRITAHIPNQATAALLGGVTCSSEPVSVDTACSEILISPVADNPQPVPANPPAQDTPLCAAEGAEVFFRVKDCDQNTRDYAADDIQRTAGTTRGLLVEVVDADGTVLDTESPDLFEVDVHGTRAVDSPYFQGSLPVTQDPRDGPWSGALMAPLDRVVTLRARYVDPDDPSDRDCEAEALLVPPVPVCLMLPAVSLGDWEGDAVVRGGDAAVAGNLLLPAVPDLIKKSPGAPLLGRGSLDRFFNLYAGGTIWVGPTELRPARSPDQPFTLDGAGAWISADHPNYFQNVPDVAGIAGRLDYDRLRLLARARGVYWEPVGGGLLRNPATGAVGTFQEITALPGPGTATATHDGRFLFVDAPPGMQSARLIDQLDAAFLPVYTVGGRYYTEGLLYVAGTVELRPTAGLERVPVEAPGLLDERYDEATGGLGREDLPVDVLPGSAPVPAGAVEVHARAALYADGEVRFLTPVRWYGAVVAEKGVRNPGGAEVWYDPRWRESRLELCSRCCRLAIEPAAPTLPPGDTLALTADGAQGAAVWESLAPAVADVDQTGLVSALAVGSSVIRVTDGAGCVAEAEVRVECNLSVEADPPALRPGDTGLVVASGLRGTPSWTSDNPGVVAITRNLGPTVEVEALDVGAARIEATDVNGCAEGVDLAVSCPGDALLSAEPAEPLPGDTVTLSVWAGPDDLSDRYAFEADGAGLPGRTYEIPGLDPVSFGARIPGTPCTLGPLRVVPRCPRVDLRLTPATAPVGAPVTIEAVGPGGEDLTDRFTFTATPPDLADIAGAALTPLAPGTVTVEGTWDRCTARPAELAITP